MTGPQQPRWSFRTRLTALIAGVFVTGGVALLGVQYVLVRGLFDTAIGGIADCVSHEDDPPVVAQGEVSVTSCLPGPEDTGPAEYTTVVAEDDAGLLVEQTTALSREILSGLLLWSAVTLLVFTVLAVVSASWLSRRSFARIGQITETTRHITRRDLHRRLALPGPPDEVKELGDTIDTMLDRLEAAFTQQDRFITNASHELRTPLTTTRAALEIPLEQGRVPEDLEPAVRRALDANRRSEQLIAALLELARTPTVSRGEDHGPVELSVVVEQSLAGRQDDVAAAHLDVTTELHGAVVRQADPTLMTLAVDNLVDNAVRHTPDGGAVRVTTGTTADRAWVELVNSGPALSEDDAARLTEPFNRGHSTRTSGRGRGLGLGLTLVQTISESVGATLTLAPVTGGGLLVRIDFPPCPEASAGPEPSAGLEASAGPEPSAGAVEPSRRDQQDP